MKRCEQFSACLKRVMDEEGISASEMARIVGFRSRNSIFRILTDQTSAKVQEEFLNTLHERLGDGWPEQHWRDLREALEVSRVGVNEYLGSKALLDLMMNSQADTQEVMVTYAAQDGSRRTEPIRPFIRELAEQGSSEISICGCWNASLFRLLAEELAQAGAAGKAHIRHYVSTEEDMVMQSIVAIQPLLYCKWYDALLVEPGCCPAEMEPFYAASVMCIKQTLHDGRKMYHHLMLCEQNKMILVSSDDGCVNDIIGMLEKYSSGMRSLKVHMNDVRTPEDYAAFAEQCRQMEAKRDIYSIKPDPSISYIHPDILAPAVLDGFRETGFAENEQLEALIPLLYDTHLKRHENFTTKRKVTYALFSMEAMREFMLTGRQTDRFFAMRTYTLAERLAILHYLRDQNARNPYFFVRFLKEDIPTPKMEITLYDGYGVLFTKADTDYNMAQGDHAEALVAHPAFAKKFREFFLRELLPKYVMSDQETMAALDALARLAARKG